MVLFVSSKVKYILNFLLGVSSPMIGGNDATKGKGGLFDDMRQRMGENVTQMVFF